MLVFRVLNFVLYFGIFQWNKSCSFQWSWVLTITWTFFCIYAGQKYLAMKVMFKKTYPWISKVRPMYSLIVIFFIKITKMLHYILFLFSIFSLMFQTFVALFLDKHSFLSIKWKSQKHFVKLLFTLMQLLFS